MLPLMTINYIQYILLELKMFRKTLVKNRKKSIFASKFTSQSVFLFIHFYVWYYVLVPNRIIIRRISLHSSILNARLNCRWHFLPSSWSIVCSSVVGETMELKLLLNPMQKDTSFVHDESDLTRGTATTTTISIIHPTSQCKNCKREKNQSTQFDLFICFTTIYTPSQYTAYKHIACARVSEWASAHSQQKQQQQWLLLCTIWTHLWV